MLVHAYATSPGKAKWSGPHQRRWEKNEFKFHRIVCYTNSSVSRIHVNTTKLRSITCTLVATGVILRSLECTLKHSTVGVQSSYKKQLDKVCPPSKWGSRSGVPRCGCAGRQASGGKSTAISSQHSPGWLAIFLMWDLAPYFGARVAAPPWSHLSLEELTRIFSGVESTALQQATSQTVAVLSAAILCPPNRFIDACSKARTELLILDRGTLKSYDQAYQVFKILELKQEVVHRASNSLPRHFEELSSLSSLQDPWTQASSGGRAQV